MSASGQKQRGLLQHNGEGDRAKAMSLLDKSLTISSELGMPPLMERVLYRREILRAWDSGLAHESAASEG